MSFEGNASSLTERQLVTFHLGDDEFGADIMNVKEIVRISEITKVPNAPSYIEGVCNLRGNVLPIIDGRSRFGMVKKENDERNTADVRAPHKADQCFGDGLGRWPFTRGAR